MTVIRVATRRSLLAMTQTRWVADQLRALRPDVEVQLVEVVTSGDRIQDRQLRDVGGKALFVKEIEEAMLEGRADLAVHSLKDLPTELPDGLVLLVVPTRADPRDVIVAKQRLASLDDLPTGARVGTSSLRRTALLLRERPDLEVRPLRGNVDTRLRKLAEGRELDAIVLAAAGLDRLGRDDVDRLPLDPTRFVAAAGQGALAIEAPEGRDDLTWIVEALEHPLTRWAVAAERSFLEVVGGSCQVPVGAHGQLVGDMLRLVGCVAAEDGDVVQLDVTRAGVTDSGGAHETGAELAQRVLLAGGRTIAEEYLAKTPSSSRAKAPTIPLARPPRRKGIGSNQALSGRRVLVTRTRDQASRLSAQLAEVGAVPVEVPALEVRPVEGPERDRLDSVLAQLGHTDWVIFTSHNGVIQTFECLSELGRDVSAFADCRVATVGKATGAALKARGLTADLIPERFDAEGLLAALEPLVSPGQRALVLRAREARQTLIKGLRGLGVEVDDVATYFTQAPADLDKDVAKALGSNLDLITFASSKTAENVVRAAGPDVEALRRVPVACIGPVTRRTATQLGFVTVVQPTTYTVDALVDAIAEWYALDPAD